jgi:NAD-dependent SIR2 family protein deacetylase
MAEYDGVPVQNGDGNRPEAVCRPSCLMSTPKRFWSWFLALQKNIIQGQIYTPVQTWLHKFHTHAPDLNHGFEILFGEGGSI